MREKNITFRKESKMFENLKKAAAGSRDRMVVAALKPIANMEMKRRGVQMELDDISLDSKNRSFSITLKVPEFREPVKLTFEEYRIVKDKNREVWFLEVEKIKKSVEWGTDYIDGKRYKIPPKALGTIRRLLGESI